ncbi:hypothetical protein [Pseudomonas turukhanskensis]|uniref:DUF3592 domain-containing protein n=1 Tax=Pseudomonas turukhanskensis TaxID=1806536 RepID=A0A9W6K3T5_9PSED|nr:hypothetical protein [Pseudomonas turukhanskensis]GLK87215.1 hypothetical protein GCM10017655_02770 [Pseudomonas turukhanskensis]
MAKLRSPGQKRKLWIRSSMVVLAVLGLTAAYFIKGPAQVAAIQLAKHHNSAQATVASLDQAEEEYRGRKGRKKTRIVYSVSYAYDINDAHYTHEQPLTAGQYDALEGQDTVEVWYPEGKPDAAQPQLVVEHLANEPAGERVFDVATWFIPVVVVLNLLLTFLFGREPKGKLPEGFYTEKSWLDVEDDRLIVLDGNHLLSMSFDKKHRDQVQEIYQRGGLNGNYLEELLSKVETKRTLVDLSTVSKMTSEHYDDTIHLKYNVDGKDESLSLEFLSATVKAHALQRIARALPANLNMSVEKLTRLQAARVPLGVAVVSAGVAYYFLDHIWVVGLLGLLGLYALKVGAARLIDPTITTTFAAAPAAAKLAVNG